MSDNIEKLVKLADLLEKGLISRVQFDRERDRLLGISEDQETQEQSSNKPTSTRKETNNNRFVSTNEQPTIIDEPLLSDTVVPDFSSALEPEEDATTLMNRSELRDSHVTENSTNNDPPNTKEVFTKAEKSRETLSTPKPTVSNTTAVTESVSEVRQTLVSQSIPDVETRDETQSETIANKTKSFFDFDSNETTSQTSEHNHAASQTTADPFEPPTGPSPIQPKPTFFHRISKRQNIALSLIQTQNRQKQHHPHSLNFLKQMTAIRMCQTKRIHPRLNPH